MCRTEVLVTRRIPDPGFQVLRDARVRFAVLEKNDERTPKRRRLLAAARRCKVLIATLTEKIDRPLLEAASGLVGVANMAVGYDNVDVKAATKLGIPVTNTPGVLDDTTADLTWALLLAVARRIPQAHNYTVAGRFKAWGPNLFLGADVSPGGSGRRKVLGVIGYGRIGAVVARRAQGFDMEVLAYDPYNQEGIAADEEVDAVGLKELLKRSDFVTLHVPLTEETRHLIGASQLKAMKPTAYLVNTARGPVVDEKALVRALKRKQIAGAALDVYEKEPALARGLAKRSNVVLVPHIASASHATRGRMAAMAATNAVACLDGKPPPNCVNPAVYKSAAYGRRVAAYGRRVAD